MGEEINFLDEIQQPRHIHQAEQRRRNGKNAGGVGFGNELSDAKSENKQNDEAGFEIVDAGRGIGNAELSGQIQKRSDHQQDRAEKPAPFETNQSTFFG